MEPLAARCKLQSGGVLLRFRSPRFALFQLSIVVTKYLPADVHTKRSQMAGVLPSPPP